MTYDSIHDRATTAPVSERIMDVLINRIQSANIADVNVVRPDREGKNIQPEHGKIVVIQRSITPNNAITHHGNPIAYGYNMDVHLRCFVRNQNAESNEYDSACNWIAAQVQMAITNPPGDSLWYRMGSLAINTFLGGQFPLTTDAGMVVGTVVPLTIQFRVSENNPYEVRA
jgi:hypothetical protein